MISHSEHFFHFLLLGLVRKKLIYFLVTKRPGWVGGSTYIEKSLESEKVYVYVLLSFDTRSWHQSYTLAHSSDQGAWVGRTYYEKSLGDQKVYEFFSGPTINHEKTDFGEQIFFWHPYTSDPTSKYYGRLAKKLKKKKKLFLMKRDMFSSCNGVVQIQTDT